MPFARFYFETLQGQQLVWDGSKDAAQRAPCGAREAGPREPLGHPGFPHLGPTAPRWEEAVPLQIPGILQGRESGTASVGRLRAHWLCTLCGAHTGLGALPGARTVDMRVLVEMRVSSQTDIPVEAPLGSQSVFTSTPSLLPSHDLSGS